MYFNITNCELYFGLVIQEYFPIIKYQYSVNSNLVTMFYWPSKNTLEFWKNKQLKCGFQNWFCQFSYFKIQMDSNTVQTYPILVWVFAKLLKITILEQSQCQNLYMSSSLWEFWTLWIWIGQKIPWLCSCKLWPSGMILGYQSGIKMTSKWFHEIFQFRVNFCFCTKITIFQPWSRVVFSWWWNIQKSVLPKIKIFQHKIHNKVLGLRGPKIKLLLDSCAPPHGIQRNHTSYFLLQFRFF